MKVQDLIAELQKLDPEAEVWLDRIDYEYHHSLDEIAVSQTKVADLNYRDLNPCGDIVNLTGTRPVADLDGFGKFSLSNHRTVVVIHDADDGRTRRPIEPTT